MLTVAALVPCGWGITFERDAKKHINPRLNMWQTGINFVYQTQQKLLSKTEGTNQILLLMSAHFWLAGCACMSQDVNSVVIQPEHLPICVNATFHQRFPTRTIDVAEQEVFRDKVQGYWCVFKDEDGTLKKTLIASNGKVGPPIVVTRLPEVEIADSRALAVGMPKAEAVKIIQEFGGHDITSGMQIVVFPPPKTSSEMPSGLFWAFDSCKMVVLLSGSERVESLSYWNWDDFNNGKERQARTERKVKALAMELKTRLVNILPIESGQ